MAKKTDVYHEDKSLVEIFKNTCKGLQRKEIIELRRQTVLSMHLRNYPISVIAKNLGYSLETIRTDLDYLLGEAKNSFKTFDEFQFISLKINQIREVQTILMEELRKKDNENTRRASYAKVYIEAWTKEITLMQDIGMVTRIGDKIVVIDDSEEFDVSKAPKNIRELQEKYKIG